MWWAGIARGGVVGLSHREQESLTLGDYETEKKKPNDVPFSQKSRYWICIRTLGSEKKAVTKVAEAFRPTLWLPRAIIVHNNGVDDPSPKGKQLVEQIPKKRLGCNSGAWGGGFCIIIPKTKKVI